MVGSDYSGDHETKTYRVYTFLLVDTDASPSWPAVRQRVRDEFLPDGRRLSFKRLGDRHRLAALRPFLQAADEFTGVCATIIINKRFERLSTGPATLSVWKALHGVRGKWDSTSFEAMVRVVHLFSMLIARWSKPRMHVSWVTDQDSIVANDERLTDLLELCGRMAGVFVQHSLGELAINTTAIDDRSRAFEDFVAIPDLVAGAMAELVSVWSRQPDWHGEAEMTLPPTSLSHKTNIVTDWFWYAGSGLTRAAIIVDQTEDGRPYVVPMTVERGTAV
ncbi:MAG: hypothetical protein HY646_16030 [Acidobacteria bacterium]|nr:hypothetical protein [Acidobacteriota bacterium]